MRCFRSLLWLGAALAAGFTAASPLWPLDLPTRTLASNFMEYRAGRFHAGLDLRTNSQTGFPCYAVEDGYVSRVRAGIGGYGRAIYLQGSSGRTYVYAHLERLADALQARVHAAQVARGGWDVDLTLPPAAIPVVAGQVLAISGQSGTSGPHLHFEVRDGAGLPLDPQACGFALDDTRAPRILTVRAIPAGPGAQVAGTPDAWLASADKGLPSELPALAVRGPVAFTTEVVETSDALGHHLAPAVLSLRVDGREVFAAHNDTLDWQRSGQIRLEFLDCEGVRERWLHRWPADTVPGRRGGLWYEALAPGDHTCELVASDRAGNTARTQWVVRVLAPDLPWPAPPATWVRTPTGMTLAGGDAPVLVPPLTAPSPPPPGATRRALDPRRDDGVLAATVLWWRPVATPTADPLSGLVPVGPAADYAAGFWPVTTPVQVPLPGAMSPAADPRTAVYRQDGRLWAYVGPLVTGSAGTRAFRLEEPGLHAAWLDTTPPLIVVAAEPLTVRPGPAPRVAGITPPRWALIDIPVGDRGSGVDWPSVEVWLDGQPLVAEPDSPRDRVLVELPADLAAGPHTLGVSAADRVGNTTSRVLRLVVPARP